MPTEKPATLRMFTWPSLKTTFSKPAFLNWPAPLPEELTADSAGLILNETAVRQIRIRSTNRRHEKGNQRC